MSKLINISLAFMLLISTVGITVDKHYCGGHFVGTWFYAADDACGMNMPAENDCCNDDITIYSVESEFQFVANTLSPDLQLVAYVVFPVLENLKAVEDKYSNSLYWHSDLSPPTTPKIYLEVESFLI